MQPEGPFLGEVAEGVLGATEIVGVGRGAGEGGAWARHNGSRAGLAPGPSHLLLPLFTLPPGLPPPPCCQLLALPCIVQGLRLPGLKQAAPRA